MTERDGYYDVESAAVCTDEDDEVVLRGEIDGIIPMDAVSEAA
ncbi:hypothetical protein [Natrinema limicola]|nr:hypothetical protein [Natrinema limicola]